MLEVLLCLVALGGDATTDKPAQAAVETSVQAGEKKKVPEIVKSETSDETVELYEIEEQLVQHVNIERQRLGLRPLVLSFDLMRSARSHCTWMCWNNSMTHTRAPVAETIAAGQQSVPSVMNSWMRSSGHRSIILGRYSRFGVSAYTSRSGTVYWAMQFQ